MCEIYYNRIQCESPPYVKQVTECQGKVREKSHETRCVKFCEIRKIIELGREGKKKWKTGVCKKCEAYYFKMGWGRDDNRRYGMGTGQRKPNRAWIALGLVCQDDRIT